MSYNSNINLLINFCQNDCTFANQIISVIKQFILIIFACISSHVLISQNLSGFIYDETNAGVPFVNVYIKNIGIGTTTDAEGKFFLRFNDPGMYEIVFSSIGFETQEIKIIFDNKKQLTIQIISGGNLPFRVIKNNNWTDEWYSFGDINALQWVNYINKLTEEIAK